LRRGVERGSWGGFIDFTDRSPAIAAWFRAACDATGPAL
jgi:hypothetical protein